MKAFPVFNSQSFRGPVKPFCPCDAGHPEDCKPEDWSGVHTERQCENCGWLMHQHQELFWCPNGSQ